MDLMKLILYYRCWCILKGMNHLKKYLILPSTSVISYMAVLSTNDVDTDLMLFQRSKTKLLNGALATIPWGINCNAVHARFRTLNNIPLHVFPLIQIIKSPSLLNIYTRSLDINALFGSVPKEIGNLTNLISL